MGLLNKKIFNTANEAFGLDLSDLSVKIVQLEDQGGKQKVSSFANVKIPAGSIYDGEIKNKEQVILAIKKAFTEAVPRKIRTKKVICSLPETKAFLRIISIPEMNEEEVREAVKWEMEANIPLPLEQVYYDWQTLKNRLKKEAGSKEDILVVAIAKPAVDQFIEVLEAAGLEPVGLEIESIAQARSLVKENEKENTTMIVDIGDRRTTFLVTKNCIPCFTSSIPISGQSFTEALSKNLNLNYEEAEKIKFRYGVGSDFKNDSIFSAMKPVLDNLAFEIERSMDFYVTGLQYSEQIDNIIVCGGGAKMLGVIPYLSKKIKREMELGDPWVNLNLGKSLPLIERNESVQFATAIGLALKGLNYEDIS